MTYYEKFGLLLFILGISAFWQGQILSVVGLVCLTVGALFFVGKVE